MKSSNKLVYGELGRFPLYIKSAARCVKYWFRLQKLAPSRYARKAYDMLYFQDTRGRVNWVSKVKNLLCMNGFGYVWMYGEVGNEKLFLKAFQSKLQDIFCQGWLSDLARSTHFGLYGTFKSCLEREKYIDLLDKDNFRKAYARFRCGVSEINCHRYRFSQLASSRICPFCPGCPENEEHVVFICHAYDELRQKYVRVDSSALNYIHLVRMLSSGNEDTIRYFATFIFLVLEKRRILIGQP